MEKLFNCPVHSSLPNDYFSLHRVFTLGQPLGPEGDLGKAIQNIASRLSGAQANGARSNTVARDMKPAVSHI
jgi:hypothetical protein